MANHEKHTESGFQVAGPRQAARLLGRGLMLRCPNCGGGPVLKHWLKLHVRCGECGLRLERGEHDYFMGSMLLNYCLAGVLLIATLYVVLVASWPEVPWTALQYGGPLAMLAMPVLLFPFSKLLWLAADIIMRPVTPEELEWHRSAASEWSTDQDVAHQA